MAAQSTRHYVKPAIPNNIPIWPTIVWLTGQVTHKTLSSGVMFKSTEKESTTLSVTGLRDALILFNQLTNHSYSSSTLETHDG